MSTDHNKRTPTETPSGKKRAEQAPRRRKDPRRGNDRVTATSAKLTFTVDDRPHLDELNLPGPRRELEGRGGATPALDVMRYVIRCPLLPALTAAIAPRGGRPAGYPDIFWAFVLLASREFGKNDHFLQELKSQWPEIAKEFYFEHGVALPRPRGVAYASFNSWRTNAILDKTHQLDILLDRFTEISVLLALAIRRAEGAEDEQRDLLNPTVWDCVAADGTMRRPPSDVSAGLDLDDDGVEVVKYLGSRAKTGAPRVHEPVSRVHKQSGPTDGLFNVVATTKGLATYTRTVLGVEIGHAGEGETPIAMRTLHRVYGHLGNQLPTLLYDGALTPISWQELMAQYGVFCVNANYARKVGTTGRGRGESGASDFSPDSNTTGEGSRKYGRKKNSKKATFVTDIEQEKCNNGGQAHVHHLAADDGAVFETRGPVLIGMPSERIQLITPHRAERGRDEQGRHCFTLHFRGDCHRGGGQFHFTQQVGWTEPDKAGHVGWRSVVANVRIIPEIAEQFPKVYGGRNQIESFFDWFEQRFYRRDRAASWGREAQTVDLIAASLLHNAEAWAHLAYRHPQHAVALAAELRALPAPDLTIVKKKPKSETKAARNARLHQPTRADLDPHNVLAEPDESEEVDDPAA